jgi:hypothetical protein
MADRKIKLLCLLDDDYGRDVEIVLPVLYFAERYLNCDLSFAFAWNAHEIYRQKPDVVFIPNATGSPFYHQIAKYAVEQNIRVFALESEGNFRTDDSFDYWGYNPDKYFYQDYICLWSKRTCDFLLDKLPQFKENIVLTGATGFDRYRIYEFEDREDFLKRKNLTGFKKIIGYAGWAFGKIYNAQGREEISLLIQDFKWLEAQMLFVESVLKKAIENNPDILFILKRHPNEANPSIVEEGPNEMNRLKNYPNVIYITEKENIHDLINVSDIWLGFETTSALEAWLLKDIPTILINPEPDFNRDKLYMGSVLVKDYNQLQILIDEFYSKGKVESFYAEELKNCREWLIQDTIGYSDGFNHIRTGYYLQKTIEKIDPTKHRYKFKIKFFIRYLLIYFGKFFFKKEVFIKLPKFKKAIWILERYKLEKIKFYINNYWPYLDRYHEKNQIKRKLNDGTLYSELLERGSI